MLAAAGRLLAPALWLGLLLGISFIETPLKFMVPGMTLGLGIGQLVFTAMNIVQVVLFIVFAASCIRRGLDRAYRWVVASLGAVLLAVLLVTALVMGLRRWVLPGL